MLQYKCARDDELGNENEALNDRISSNFRPAGSRLSREMMLMMMMMMMMHGLSLIDTANRLINRLINQTGTISTAR
jgi:hypothetical protein